MASKRKVIITVAQTGNFQGKAANPALPEQPSEIITSAYDCYNAGAAIVHIHARDKAGNSSNDPNIFAEINTGVRAKCPIIIQNSTAPATGTGFRGRRRRGICSTWTTSRACPRCARSTARSSPRPGATCRSSIRWERDWLLKNAKRMMDLGIKPELRSLQRGEHRRRLRRALSRRACSPTRCRSPSSWA